MPVIIDTYPRDVEVTWVSIDEQMQTLDRGYYVICNGSRRGPFDSELVARERAAELSAVRQGHQDE